MKARFDDHLYRKSATERRQIITDHFHLNHDEQQELASHATSLGDEMVENYLTNYGLPEGVCTGLVVNHQQYTIPMVTEEPSVIAAACNGAKRVARSGGFDASKQDRLVIGQIVLRKNDDFDQQWLLDHQAQLIQIANDAHPSLKRRGAGAKKIRFRDCGKFASCDLFVDVSQAMGANSVDTMAEAVAHYLAQTGYSIVTAILSNLATGAVQEVSCRVDFHNLQTAQMSGSAVAKRIAEISDLAAVDPYRAATNNKGIMNGVDAVLIASGNDWRAIESGAHTWASRNGKYQGLSRWAIESDALVGKLSLPLPVGVVGGSIGLNPQTRINQKISEIKSAEELSAVVASVGLAQNLAALRALVTTGIQAGHMKLQYRSLAIAVGAQGAEINQLASLLAKESKVDRTVAKQALVKLRKDIKND